MPATGRGAHAWCGAAGGWRDARSGRPSRRRRSRRPRELARERATPASRPRPPPTACGGRRSTIRRSIAWSSSPTGRTCRCRSPACGSSRRAPSSASPSAGSFPRRRRRSPAATAVGLSEQVAALHRRSTDNSVGTTRSASTRPGSWISGASTGAAWRRKRASLLATVADYDAAIVSLTAEVARTYVVIRTVRGADRAGPGERRASGGGAADRRVPLPERRDVGAGCDAGDDAAGEHAGVDPELRDRPAPGAERPEHAARAADRTPSSALLGRAQGDPEAAREGGGRRAGRDAAAASRHPRRRAAGPPRSATASASPRRSSIPSFSLFGTIGLRSAEQRRTAVLSNLFAPGSLFYSVGPSIIWPFLNYGRADEQRARRGRALPAVCSSSYRDTVLKAAQEVEDALTGFLERQEAMVFEQNAVTAAANGR